MNRKDALTGAMVADAAAMGLHWLYDQDRIASISQSRDVLFNSPDPADYKDVKGYFAHPGRQAGDLSHYGEALAMFNQLLADGDSYDIEKHRALFLERFGPGGSFIGYADRPTKALVAKMIAGDSELAEASGADDDQLPAVIPVAAFFTYQQSADDLEKAVRVTANNPVAVEGALAVFTVLETLASGQEMAAALKSGVSNSSGELQELLSAALEMDSYAPLAAANKFGMPCHIPQGLPVVWHMLAHTSDFETLVRDNIRCGGDSCGRAMALGAIAGFAGGVPSGLVGRLSTPV